MHHTTQIDAAKPFSQSVLWQHMRTYYAEQGISAWIGAVPYYVTSHPFMAKTYAKILIQTILDWQAQHPEQLDEQFVIVELAAGCGKLSHLLLNHLYDLLIHYQLPINTIQYVMTDFASENIRFWQTQPELQKHIDSGMLDFALCDLENFDCLELITQKQSIHAGSALQTPLMLLGNYILDTLPADIFVKQGGTLYEAMVSAYAQEDVDTHHVLKKDNVQLQHDTQPVTFPHYGDSLDTALQKHTESDVDGYFLFPNVALRALEKFQSFSQANIVLLASDKGYNQRSELRNLGFPNLTFHSSFSIMVNFVALADWFSQYTQHTIVKQQRRAGISTFYASSAFGEAEYRNLRNVANDCLVQFSSGDFYMMYRGFIETLDGQSANAIIAFLAFAQWDEYIFNKLHQTLLNKINTANANSISFLLTHLDDIARNHYNMPNSTDTYFNLGSLAMTLKDYQQATKYFEISAQHYKDQAKTYYQLGLCAYFCSEKDNARRHFQRALTLNPIDVDSEDWLNRLVD